MAQSVRTFAVGAPTWQFVLDEVGAVHGSARSGLMLVVAMWFVEL